VGVADEFMHHGRWFILDDCGAPHAWAVGLWNTKGVGERVFVIGAPTKAKSYLLALFHVKQLPYFAVREVPMDDELVKAAMETRVSMERGL
jgi:hypothetical protein